MNARSFFSELKRRRVYSVAAAYVVVAWLFIQVATQVFPFFRIPNWVVRLIVLLTIVGFPVSVVCAWAFEMTPEGIKLEGDVDRRLIRKTGRKLTALVVIAAAIAAGVTIFRFLHSQQSIEAAKQPPLAVVIEGKSIAVLPFENRSEDKANAYFADGVQDQVLTDLSQIADLKVISRTSVMQYKSGITRDLREIGQQLGVAHLLEGSVQRSANKIRVNAQLIDARTGAHVWAETYDRDLPDIFAIQSEIAKAIAEQLQAKLLPDEKRAIERPPTNDVVAFDLYSRAKDLMLIASGNATIIEKSIPQALDFLKQAVARDPEFFHAYCLMAYAHDRAYFFSFDRTPERLAQAQAALDAAARLRPDAGETHLARAQHLYNGYLDYPAAVAELEIARRSLPNEPRVYELLGFIARRQGKAEESLRYLARALDLDPRNFSTLIQTGLSYGHRRRYVEAAAIYDRALAIYPDNWDAQLARAGVDIAWKADTRAYRRVLDELRQKDPVAFKEHASDVFIVAMSDRDVPAAEAALLTLGGKPIRNNALVYNATANAALLARMAGNEEKARAAFAAAREEQEKTVQAQPNSGPALALLGLYDAGLGRREEALHNGRRAMELLPVEKDSLNGARVLTVFVTIAAWVGEKDLALEHLARAVQLPAGPTYGALKLDVDWDPLRGDPRFEKIVESLAPKQ